MKVKRVMFVCMGNICRSPLAQGIFQKMVNDRGLNDAYFIESSGTCAYHVGEQADSRMRKTASYNGIQLNHKSRQIFRYDLEDSDYIFAMDQNNYQGIQNLTTHRELLMNLYLFRDFDPIGNGDVPDPYYGGQEGFDDVFDIVLRTCTVILDKMEEGTF